jgi:proteasome accessory factor BC
MAATAKPSRIDPIERVLNLLTLLHESRTPLTRAEIVAKLAASDAPYPDDEDAQHQQFTVDRRTIASALGTSIRQRPRGGEDAGRTEYWIDAGDVRLPELHLDDDERLVLSLALAAVSRSLPHAGEAQLKLGVDPAEVTPFDFNVDVPDVALTVIEAARTAGVVEFNAGAERLELEPWAVVLHCGAWVVVGHDVRRSGARTVRLDRTARVRVLAGRRRTAPVWDLDDATVSTLAADAAEEPVIAQVVVDEVTAARASLSPNVIERRQVDLFGQVCLRVLVGDVARFRSWLLGLGARAHLLGPADLRAEVIDWLGEIADHRPSCSNVPSKPPTAGRRRGPEPVADRLHRLLAIVPWLYRHGSAHVDEIAGRIGATREQVVRDLTAASMCGLPPYTFDNLYGFWVEDDRVHVTAPTLLSDDVRLTLRQAATVAVALSALDALPGGDHDASKRLRAKLEDALGDWPVRVDVDDPPFLDDVRAAVERHERIRIEYVDLEDHVTERDFDPLKLFVDRGSAYVLGDDHLRGEQRVFRVDRLLSVVPTGEVFEPRPVTPPAGRTWAWTVPHREVVVRLPPGSEWVVDRYATIAHSVAVDGWLTVWLSVVSEPWLASLVLRCGPGAEVLAPSDVVALPARRARAALGRYA